MARQKISCIYLIENTVNKKVYIGQTQDFYGRMGHHRSFLRRGKHCNKYLQAAWNKYGEGNFKFGIGLRCDPGDLNLLEYCIGTAVRREELYNVGSFGDSAVRGMKMSEETKIKMRLAPRSQEHRKKIGNAMRGKKHPPTEKRLAAIARRGSKSPEELSVKIECIESGESFSSMRAAAKALGVTTCSIVRRSLDGLPLATGQHVRRI